MSKIFGLQILHSEPLKRRNSRARAGIKLAGQFFVLKNLNLRWLLLLLIFLSEPVEALSLNSSAAEQCLQEAYDTIQNKAPNELRKLNINNYQEFVEFINSPYFIRIQERAASLAAQIRGELKVTISPPDEHGHRAIQATGTPRLFKGSDVEREFNWEEYDEVLQKICSEMSRLEGLDVTSLCFSSVKKSIENFAEIMKKMGPYLIEHIKKSFSGNRFDPKKILNTDSIPRFFECPGESSNSPRSGNLDPVIGTAFCYGQTHRLPMESKIFTGGLVNQEGQIVGRLLPMQVGDEIEIFYAPMVSGGPSYQLLNPVFFMVFGGSAKEWNAIVESKFGPLKPISMGSF